MPKVFYVLNSNLYVLKWLVFSLLAVISHFRTFALSYFRTFALSSRVVTSVGLAQQCDLRYGKPLQLALKGSDRRGFLPSLRGIVGSPPKVPTAKKVLAGRVG